jgi:sulfite exporter TauE/SafE
MLLAYHGARAATYVALAAAAGFTGQALTSGGLGRAVSIGSGLFLLIAAARSGSLVRSTRRRRWWSGMLTRMCSGANRSARTGSLAAHALVGLVNGLLPCGLAYAAVIAAAGWGGVVSAMAFMTGFGLGTSPVLIAISLSTASFPLTLRSRLRRVAPLALVLTGVLLIARGVMPAHHALNPAPTAAPGSHVH